MNREHSEPWGEPPGAIVVPVGEPGESLPQAEFAFNKRVRDWWMRVADYECQTQVYTERAGYTICGREAREVDHIIPESVLIEMGVDPNTGFAMPRCVAHHRSRGIASGGRRLAEYGEPNWSKHPDMGDALAQYRLGDPDAFKKAVREHREATARGERFWNSDEGVDQFEIDWMKQMAYEYVMRTGDRRPRVKPHPAFRKRWGLR